MTFTPIPKLDLPTNHERRIARAMLAVEGVAIGDALGNYGYTGECGLPEEPWYRTDDTEMSLGIVEV